MKKLLFLIAFAIPSLSNAASFSVEVSTQNKRIVEHVTGQPLTKSLQVVVDEYILFLSNGLVRDRVLEKLDKGEPIPQTKDEIINEITTKSR